jgi:TetR/AcrR family transcriptional regulator, lmrAB and yxaGH operons repressor
MPRSTDARTSMIESAAMLFRERGVQGTSFSDVLAHSRAPRGSIYHHFGGGKTQLAEEATVWAGELTAAGLAADLAAQDPPEAIAAFCAQWAAGLLASDFAAGCPIVAATLEGQREPTVRDAAGEVFDAWQDLIRDALRRRGIAIARARSIATLAIAAIEGAVVLARAERSTRPLERVAEELRRVIGEALARAQP